MGARAKNNPPRRRGPKPEVLVQPGRVDAVAKSLKKKGPEAGWPKPHSKGRGK
jgi:hypothetical protein